MKQKIMFIAFGSIIISFFAYVFLVWGPNIDVKRYTKFRNYYDNGHYTITKCIKSWEGKYSVERYSYVIGDNVYEFSPSKNYRVFQGEHFLLVYNPSEKKNDILELLEFPIVQDSTLFTSIEANKIYEEKTVLYFEYEFKGKFYERKLPHRRCFPERYKKITQKNLYKILVNINNPRIAYPILEDSIVPRVKF